MQQGPTYAVEIIVDEAGFDSIGHEWRELFAASPNASTPLKWEWMREWWRTFGKTCGRAPGGLRIITVRRDGTMVACLPLYLQKLHHRSLASLRFISTGEVTGEVTYPEYLNILLRDNNDSKVIQLVEETIFEGGLEWDEVDFGILSPNSPLVEIAADKFQNLFSEMNIHTSYRCRLAPSIDELLNNFKPTVRRQCNRLLRQMNNNNYSFEVACTVEDALKYFKALTHIHSERWAIRGRPGSFRSERIISFHRALITKLFDKNEVYIAALKDGDVPAAVIYGFITGPKFDFYQGGIDVRHPSIKSPGILAHLLSMNALGAKGIGVYDFLPGYADYKARFATDAVSCKSVQIRKPTLNIALTYSLQKISRVPASLYKRVIALI